MVTATYTAGDAITQAFRMAGIQSKDEDVAAEDTAYALTVLNRMLKRWQASEELDWTLTYLSHALTASATQTLTPVRPVRIRHVNFRQNSIDRPLTMMTRDEYDNLPNKGATGEPTTWYYDRQREAATLYIWPVPSSVSGKTLEITYERELPDLAAASDTLDVPGEYWDATVAELAAQLCLDYTQPPAITGPVAQRAAMLKDQMLRSQNEGSIWFGEAEY